MVTVAITGYIFKDRLLEKKQSQQPQATSEQKPDNAVNYESATSAQKQAQPERPKDEQKTTETYPNKLVISRTNKEQNGNYVIAVYSAESKDASARCVLSLNGKQYQEVGVQLYPHMAVCKGFTITATDIVRGKNIYDITFLSGSYKDKESGEFEG